MRRRREEVPTQDIRDTIAQTIRLLRKAARRQRWELGQSYPVLKQHHEKRLNQALGGIDALYDLVGDLKIERK